MVRLAGQPAAVAVARRRYRAALGAWLEFAADARCRHLLSPPADPSAAPGRATGPVRGQAACRPNRPHARCNQHLDRARLQLRLKIIGVPSPDPCPRPIAVGVFSASDWIVDDTQVAAPASHRAADANRKVLTTARGLPSARRTAVASKANVENIAVLTACGLARRGRTYRKLASNTELRTPAVVRRQLRGWSVSWFTPASIQCDYS